MSRVERLGVRLLAPGLLIIGTADLGHLVVLVLAALTPGRGANALR